MSGRIRGTSGGPEQGQRPLRAWPDLAAAERDALLQAYQAELDRTPRTCSFDEKLARMQAWLGDRGVAITEADIRGSGRGPHGSK